MLIVQIVANILTKSISKMLGPFATASRRTPIHQVSLSHAACASMFTTTTPTTTRDRGDRYGPIEWAQQVCRPSAEGPKRRLAASLGALGESRCVYTLCTSHSLIYVNDGGVVKRRDRQTDRRTPDPMHHASRHRQGGLCNKLVMIGISKEGNCVGLV